MHSPLVLRAWQAAMQVATRTRAIIDQFPPRGYAALRDQMTRSSESIGHNIADGRGSSSPSEFLNYLDHAARSATELNSQLTHVRNYGIAPPKDVFNLIGTVICTRKLIDSLRERIRADDERTKRDARHAKRRVKERDRASDEDVPDVRD